MSRRDRLFDLLTLLQDGATHRAQDIAARLGVSLRTVYRDMDTLAASGIAVEGTRGAGYRLAPAVTLPPLTLSEAELEALNLGIAVVLEAADPDLAGAARSLAEKIDGAVPAEPAPAAPPGLFALHPLASAARGLSHMALLRGAILGRQKLRLTCRRPDGGLTERTVRPLHMACWGRIWTLTAWCELRGDFRVFRVDLIEAATALPELFVDEPGRRYADYLAAASLR